MYSGRRFAGSVEIATNSIWWVGRGGGYDQLYCPASPKLLLGLDLGLGCDNLQYSRNSRNKGFGCFYVTAILSWGYG